MKVDEKTKELIPEGEKEAGELALLAMEYHDTHIVESVCWHKLKDIQNRRQKLWKNLEKFTDAKNKPHYFMPTTRKFYRGCPPIDEWMSAEMTVVDKGEDNGK